MCFDLSDNSLGRAALLAQAVSKVHEVELIGPIRPGGLWEPMKDIRLPVKSFPWKRYPSFFPVIGKMLDAIDGDVVVACKLRPTSFGIGAIKKALSRRTPLIVDIDDWELGFYLHSGFWGTVGRALNFSNPNGLPYTWLMERFLKRADAVIVSNSFLQKRFSGALLYHCRDTEVLDPEKFDGSAMKKKLGMESEKIVMFLGTPREHKGVEDLFFSLEGIPDKRICIVVVGAGKELDSMLKRHEKHKDRIKIIPKIPFSRLPDYLSAADVIAIPQRATSDTAGQMPAKIFDAMSMAKPVVATRVSDIPAVLGECGYLVEPDQPGQIAEAINGIFDNPEEAKGKGALARQRCRKLYDIKNMEDALLNLIENSAGGKTH